MVAGYSPHTRHVDEGTWPQTWHTHTKYRPSWGDRSSAYLIGRTHHSCVCSIIRTLLCSQLCRHEFRTCTPTKLRTNQINVGIRMSNYYVQVSAKAPKHLLLSPTVQSLPAHLHANTIRTHDWFVRCTIWLCSKGEMRIGWELVTYSCVARPWPRVHHTHDGSHVCRHYPHPWHNISTYSLAYAMHYNNKINHLPNQTLGPDLTLATFLNLWAGRYSIHTGSEHILFGTYEPSCLPVTRALTLHRRQ